MTRILTIGLAAGLLVGWIPTSPAADDKLPPPVTGVELQPLAAQVQRVAQALDLLGALP